ncbi:MAG: TetR/AcrR family transcriptional regulator [Spirochaetaceae bacterium]|nr:TetR/AcrR family transcriptional regulator [Spirochaetaceae bacterium]
MPRKKQFEVDAALTKAMREFWGRGYHPTSMQDLVDCMGIGRGSIYDTFGSKRGLFMRSLDRYIKLYASVFQDVLAKSTSPSESILNVFEDAIAALVVGGSRDGCFVINTAAELAAHDDEVAEVVTAMFRDTEQVFRALIEQGQELGEIPPTVDAVLTARSLLSLYIGLRILTRSNPDMSVLQAIKSQAGALIS